MASKLSLRPSAQRARRVVIPDEVAELDLRSSRGNAERDESEEEKLCHPANESAEDGGATHALGAHVAAGLQQREL